MLSSDRRHAQQMTGVQSAMIIYVCTWVRHQMPGSKRNFPRPLT
jgi:hypothetical protein